MILQFTWPTSTLSLLALLLCAAQACAQDYRVETLSSPPPAEGVAPAILEQVTDTGFKVIKGKNRTVCEIWPAKEWSVKADFSPDITILYPFEMGELIGLVRYPRKGEDFRGQEIGSGVYTMRYSLQPVDGNHVGTSDTRDFIALLPADKDSDPKPLDKDALFKLSREASSTTHPAILALLTAGDSESLPAIVHNESRELWSLRFANQAKAGDQASKLVVELVLIGKAPE
jgi:hypothetical protein